MLEEQEMIQQEGELFDLLANSCRDIPRFAGQIKVSKVELKVERKQETS
jgi:hypothetical protein